MRRNRGSVIFPIKGVTIPPKRINSISHISLDPSANKARNVAFSSIDPFTKQYMKIISDIADEDEEDSMTDEQRMERIYGISKNEMESEAERAGLFEAIAGFLQDKWEKINKKFEKRKKKEAEESAKKQSSAKVAAEAAAAVRKREEIRQEQDTLMNLPIIDEIVKEQEEKEEEEEEEEGEEKEKISLPYLATSFLPSTIIQLTMRNEILSDLQNDIEQYGGISVPTEFILKNMDEFVRIQDKIKKDVTLEHKKSIREQNLTDEQQADQLKKLQIAGYEKFCKIIGEKWGVSQDARKQEEKMIGEQLESLRRDDPNPYRGNFPIEHLSSLLYQIARTHGSSDHYERLSMYVDLIPQFYELMKKDWTQKDWRDLNDMTTRDAEKLLQKYHSDETKESKFFDYFFFEDPDKPAKRDEWIENIFRRYLADLSGDETSTNGFDVDKRIFRDAMAALSSTYSRRLKHLRKRLGEKGLETDIVADQFISDVFDRIEELNNGVVTQPEYVRLYQNPASNKIRINRAKKRDGSFDGLSTYDTNTLFYILFPRIQDILIKSNPKLFENGNPFVFRKQRKTK